MSRAASVIPVRDAIHRPLRNLRISVTDKCNLRCQYCMPEDEYQWLPKEHLLTFDEISYLVNVFMSLGVDKVRLTGGEPLLRRDLPKLVEILSAKSGLRDLAITTNGTLLARHVGELRSAGLCRITVSLDTLDPERFRQIARRGDHAAVVEGLHAIASAGFTGTKIDTVVMKGINDDEIVDLVEFGKTIPAEVRFIEYMDVGGATNWSAKLVCSRREILSRLQLRYGTIMPVAPEASAPADRFALPDGTTVGVISSTTLPFCATCDRSRLTADGMWYRCLYAQSGTDLRGPLRNGWSVQAVADLVAREWRERRDQGAVDRLLDRSRSVFIPASALKLDPHLEMHTRGG